MNATSTESESLPTTALGLMVGMLVLFTLTRMVLLALTGAASVPVAFWPRIFLLGLWFDLLVILAAGVPSLWWTALTPGWLRRARIYPWLRFVALWLASFLLFSVAVAEVTFWLEFSTRFNFIAVDYLLYTQEVIGNIRESYPVPWIFSALGLASLVPPAVLTRLLRPGRSRAGRSRMLCAAGGTLLAVGGMLLGNIDQMSGSGNAFADELAGNGVMTFTAALRRNELDYDRFYDALPQAEADRILKGLDVERVPLSEALKDQPDIDKEPMGPLRRTPRHVVLISVESLSAEFLDSFGGQGHLSPNLDRLGAEGYRFLQVYATGTRTVRGLEALSLGTPPVPGQAIVRRPKHEHLATIGEILQMQGFESLWIYGGYGYFDNMNAYFHDNDYTVVDRSSFPSSSVVFENAWGVADESLYLNAIPAIRRSAAGGKRVFAHIMTTSNHRPFTYPDGRIDIPSPGGRAGGIKYTDFAIGQFMEAARKEPWFRDTLFVITADHCASVAGKTHLPVDKYRIPMIWYAPDLVAPGSDSRMISQLDVPPTLLDILGVRGDDQFFGLSVFEQKESNRRAFISNYQALGYLKNDMLTVLLPKHRSESFRVDPVSLEMTRIAVNPVLHDEAVAYYQTAAHAFRQGRLAAPEFLRARP